MNIQIERIRKAKGKLEADMKDILHEKIQGFVSETGVQVVNIRSEFMDCTEIGNTYPQIFLSCVYVDLESI